MKNTIVYIFLFLGAFCMGTFFFATKTQATNYIEFPNPICFPSPTPTIDEPTPSPTEGVEATATPAPTNTPSSNNNSAGSDGRSDGLGCGSHDCNTVIPKAPPATGFGK